jgi:hypothetical protein
MISGLPAWPRWQTHIEQLSKDLWAMQAKPN